MMTDGTCQPAGQEDITQSDCVEVQKPLDGSPVGQSTNNGFPGKLVLREAQELIGSTSDSRKDNAWEGHLAIRKISRMCISL